MTKRPITLALLATAALALAACSKSEPAAAEAKGEHHGGFTHVAVTDGDATRGSQLAAKKLAGGQACVDCHGPAGAKPIDPTYPALAGQYSDYIFHALKQYRDGGRTHALMGGQIKAAVEAGELNDQAFADLAVYFGQQQGSLSDLHGKH